jgi:hypothetical protein
MDQKRKMFWQELRQLSTYMYGAKVWYTNKDIFHIALCLQEQPCLCNGQFLSFSIAKHALEASIVNKGHSTVSLAHE